MYKRKVDVNMLNTVKSVLADVLSISPSSDIDLTLILYIVHYYQRIIPTSVSSGSRLSLLTLKFCTLPETNNLMFFELHQYVSLLPSCV